jgi:hypothetical protein
MVVIAAVVVVVLMVESERQGGGLHILRLEDDNIMEISNVNMDRTEMAQDLLQ